MAVATLATAVGAQSTDRRQMTDVIRRIPAVRHWWTLAQRLSYADPVTGFPSIRARIGTHVLVSSANTSFVAEGGYMFPQFKNSYSTHGAFQTRLPAMTGKWSFINIRRAVGGRAWGLWIKGGNAYTIQDNAMMNPSPVLNFLPAGLSDDRVAYAPTPVGSARTVAFHCVDFANGTVQGALDQATPHMPPKAFSTWATHATDLDAEFNLMVGAGRGNFPMTGVQLDFAVVQGDIFTMPDLTAAFLEYARTAYQG